MNEENIYEIAHRRKVERDKAREEVNEIKRAIVRYLDGMGITQISDHVEGFDYQEGFGE